MWGKLDWFRQRTSELTTEAPSNDDNDDVTEVRCVGKHRLVHCTAFMQVRMHLRPIKPTKERIRWMLSYMLVSFILIFCFESQHTAHGFLDASTLSRSRPATHLLDKPFAPLISHHVAVKTRNITTAIQFYSLLGFEPEAKFRAGPARAAWLTQPESPSSRIELLEVPSYLLNEPKGMKRRAMNLMERQELLGCNHLALDVTGSLERQGHTQLSEWMQTLNATSVERFGRGLRVALEPRQQIIGKNVFELAFLFDADGALIEFVNKQSNVEQEITSGWDVWDGKGFV